MPPAVLGAPAVWVNVSAAGVSTVTVAAHSAVCPPAGSRCPVSGEETLLVRDWSPLSGLFTVTV